MNIQCRFANECNEYRSDNCLKCLHNRRRNAPPSFYEEAADMDYKNSPMRRGVNMTIKSNLGPGAYVYTCPACDCTVDVGQPDGDGYMRQCECCGLTVISLY